MIPVRYHPLMALAVLEKATFFGVCLWLWQASRLQPVSGPFIGAMIDGALMLAFHRAAWCLTSRPQSAGGGSV